VLEAAARRAAEQIELRAHGVHASAQTQAARLLLEREQAASAASAEVSGRLHIVCGRFDWDWPICSACSCHEMTE
jgi:hypothetical protein